jgi:hypothetical protein
LRAQAQLKARACSSEKFVGGGAFFAGRIGGRGAPVAMPRQAVFSHDDRNPTLGEVSNLCYGEDGPPCLVNLKVRPASRQGAPPP